MKEKRTESKQSGKRERKTRLLFGWPSLRLSLPMDCHKPCDSSAPNLASHRQLTTAQQALKRLASASERTTMPLQSPGGLDIRTVHKQLAFFRAVFENLLSSAGDED